MNQSKIVRMGLVVILAGLVLSGVLSRPASGREASQAEDTLTYVPIVTGWLSLPPISPNPSLISVSWDGVPSNGDSFEAALSANGRYIAFVSAADNLVPADTNQSGDIFVHDQLTGETTRVSVAEDGVQGNDESFHPSISADGRYVAFSAWASNLVPDDANDSIDVFVHDRQTGQTDLISVTSDGAQANDRAYYPAISADGRFVAFQSDATNLVAGDTNKVWDVFIHDRQTGETTLISAAPDGAPGDSQSEGPSVSADGRYIAFSSVARNLDPETQGDGSGIFIHDRQTGQNTQISEDLNGEPLDKSAYLPSISADGRFVAYMVATYDDCGFESMWDIFFHDRQTGQTTLVSVASDGTPGNLRSWFHSISADGRYVAFSSYADNLVPDDTNDNPDVFVHDRQTGQTSRITMAANGTQTNNPSQQPSISADGRFVAFHSWDSNLVSGDLNGYWDIFVYDREAPKTNGGPGGVSVTSANEGSDVVRAVGPRLCAVR